MKTNIFVLENRLKFELVWDPFLIDFGSLWGRQNLRMLPPMLGWKTVLVLNSVHEPCGKAPRRPERPHEAPKKLSTGPQSGPRVPSEVLRSRQYASRAAQNAPRHAKSCFRWPKTPPRSPQAPRKRPGPAQIASGSQLGFVCGPFGGKVESQDHPKRRSRGLDPPRSLEDRKLASFAAFWAAKLGQVRFETCVGIFYS